MGLNRDIPARDLGYDIPQTLRKEVTYLDDDVAVTVGVIPAGAVVIDAGVVVTEAFDAGTSNVLDIGTSSDGDGFATDLALGTVGRIVADALATSNDLYDASNDVTVTATPALTGTAATAGSGFVYVTFIA